VVQGDDAGPVRPHLQQQLVPDLRLRAHVDKDQRRRRSLDLLDHRLLHLLAEVAAPGEAPRIGRQQRVDHEVLLDPTADQFAAFSAEQNEVGIRSFQRADGAVGSFTGALRRSEVSLEREAEDGTRLKGSFFSSGAAAGFGFSASRPDLAGSTSAWVEYRKPDWDFVQSLAQGGTRDRVELKRELRAGSRVTAELTAAANRYDLPGLLSAARSVAASASVAAKLLRRPRISASYSLDAEYVLSEKELPARNGALFHPLPLVNREPHPSTLIE